MFEYLAEKVDAIEICHEPFEHVYVDDFLSEEHFSAITRAQEIALPLQSGDRALFESLFDLGYKIVNFPGCITDMEKYMAWHQDRSNQAKHHTACEGFGMTLRLVDSSSGILQELLAFLESEQWNQTLANKFGLVLSDTYTDNGIQKYLDGYEISPHPDIRRKALTFMVNVNAHPESESWAHHTHYLKLKPEFSYVQSFWESNEDCDRCWVPWHWCETVSMQSKNNSAVIFSPSNDTLHGVKASYDHLVAQRTQLYGNLWYRDVPDLDVVEWEAFDVRNHSANQLPLSHRIFRILPKALRNALKQIVLPDSKNVIRDRKKF